MDIQAIIIHAFDKTIKHRRLWFYGMIANLTMFAVIAFFVVLLLLGLIILVNILVIKTPPAIEWGHETTISLAKLTAAALFITLLLAFLQIVGQVLHVKATNEATLNNVVPRTRRLYRDSRPAIWKIIKLDFCLFIAGVTAYCVTLVPIMILTLLTMGIFTSLMYPVQQILMIVSSIWYRYTSYLIIIKDIKVLDAMKQSWLLLKQNLLNSGALSIVIMLVTSPIGLMYYVLAFVGLVVLVLPESFEMISTIWNSYRGALLSGTSLYVLIIWFATSILTTFAHAAFIPFFHQINSSFEKSKGDEIEVSSGG